MGLIIHIAWAVGKTGKCMLHWKQQKQHKQHKQMACEEKKLKTGSNLI